MTRLSISKKLKDLFPRLILGVVYANVTVEKSSKELWDLINKESQKIISEFTLDKLPSTSGIFELREAYKKLGKSPSRYRGSAEALIRRLLQGKELYRVNNIVDINNLVSICSRFPVGSYDIESISFPVQFRIGKKGEKYKGIGKQVINVASLPVFCDTDGPYGSPTSDSEKAMIKINTKSIMMVIISFSGESKINEYLSFAENLLVKYAHGKEISKLIVR